MDKDPTLESLTAHVTNTSEEVRKAALTVALGTPKDNVAEVLGMLGILDAVKEGRETVGDTELFIPIPGLGTGYIDPKRAGYRTRRVIRTSPRAI